ncbi:NAD(P)-dependent oxidoreductase [Clostridium sp. MSJ-4]|uniref:precorrin-2 dehydrogenase n=1 Tax=Clostridium simiarum TaxID=2841506 RepID=A0ABS6EWE2_9CLOT|nr:NAD(P)-dependent oxidoreductase [Clostridium simiarum]MBU5590549.1 NAD(P)-dependent oxidoreductase [Clostridium simiarum]
MSRNNREDFSEDGLDFAFISLISKKLKVLIFGAGEAGYIKTKAFINRGCQVSVVAKSFEKRFNEFNQENLHIIKDSYKKTYILDKHLIIIALEDKGITDEIIEHCEELNKLYLTCWDFTQGNFVVPIQRSTKEINFALSIKKGNPKLSKYLANSIENYLVDFDNFIAFGNILRERVKSEGFKKEILSFISQEDFKYYFEKGYGIQVLLMFYPTLIDFLGVEWIEYENCYKKKQVSSSSN